MLEALLTTYRTCAVEASRQLFKSWRIVPGVCALYALFTLAAMVLAPLGMVGGLALGLLGAFFLSCYYRWLLLATRSERVTWEDLIRFDSALFSGVLNTGFILWIISLGVDFLAEGSGNAVLSPAVALVLVLALNALPECIYLRGVGGAPALSEAFIFTRDNWIEWFLPFLLILSPVFFHSFEYGGLHILTTLATSRPLLPPLVILTLTGTVFAGFGVMVSILVGLLVANWFMLFRGNLFRELDEGGIRRRQFKAKIGQGWR